MRGSLVIFLVAISVFSGCKSSNFSGGSTQPSPKNADPVEPTPPGTTTTPTGCTPGKTVIVVTAKTPSVDQFASDAKVVYDMTLQDCPGTTPKALANKIEFDLDAVVTDVNGGVVSDARVNALPFKINVDGTATPVTGTLNHVSGSDLFGKSGSNYGHYESNNVVSFAAEQRHATIEISVAGIRIHSPANNASFNPDAMSYSIDTFFKFGDSGAVTVPVTFNK